MNKDTKILFVGGHYTPAIAVWNELKKRGYENFAWTGYKFNQEKNKNFAQEYTQIKSMEITHFELNFAKSNNSSFKKIILNFLNIIRGFAKSIYIIQKFKPEYILTFGGYLAIPITLTGKLFGVKIFAHEQTITIGRANKFIFNFADIIALSFEESKNLVKKQHLSKIFVTGNPIREEILNPIKSEISKQINKKFPTIFVTGGNQGSNIINTLIFEILKKLLKTYNIIHQTGNSTVTKDFEKSEKIKEDILKNESKNLNGAYLNFEYLNANQMGESYNISDLVISRAGANSVNELYTLQKFAILIPIPNSIGNEQLLNAEFLESKNLAIILEQNNELTSNLLLTNIKKVFKNNLKFSKNIVKIQKSSEMIVNLIERNK